MAVPVEIEEALAAKLAVLLPHLDERQRRLYLASEARELGHGGVAAVARAAGVSRVTVSAGVAELEAGAEPLSRARRPGGGRKRAADADAGLVPALLALVEPDQRGDPMSPLRWTTKSTRKLAAELTRQGHKVGADTVGGLLRAQGFSLQGNAKTIEGAAHPDRDAQFRYISEQAGAHQRTADPVISVDAKKKERIGNFRNPGRQWRPKGDPVRVRDHDFCAGPDAGTAIPYGIYDLAANAGWVSVGTDHDTAAFAVESIRRWWHGAGRAAYPHARRLLITADAGGSNGYRTRAWKAGIAALAAETGLEITVCHFPPGTSKWNKIEHRLFAHITMNWRGRPLTSHQVIVAAIAATTTVTGLTVHAEVDAGLYPAGEKISDQQMSALPLTRHRWHGDWNYTLHPRPLPGPTATTQPPPGPPGPARAARCDQATLAALAGLPRPGLEPLTAALALPWNARREALRYHWRGGPRRNRPAATGRPLLDLTDHVLVTLLYQRLRLPQHVIARLVGTHPDTVRLAITTTSPLLPPPPPQTPAPRLRTLDDLIQYAATARITIPDTIR